MRQNGLQFESRAKDVVKCLKFVIQIENRYAT